MAGDTTARHPLSRLVASDRYYGQRQPSASVRASASGSVALPRTRNRVTQWGPLFFVSGKARLHLVAAIVGQGADKGDGEQQ